ncbi:helix-turn-helix domain-containing protein [Intrasporangium sp.]|uniref:TetR/AcrR family transcriptional regulator n=1 Tax=Intrasporangium sp. TaxID=1925024 RepID=UPI00293B8074|nr:helix-turn-helix domain-containing protein [Intrasporangium sp.]MDV3221031.1 TetR/AcrR family transcriptional regulator; helix-turn-helix transcriptional regulator [Intrasporangium sp.]
MPSLREQWRRNAMHVIQERALDLFDERGFAAVTIEEIAAAAEVSPSSVYRYFGTKEGLLVADEFDTMAPETLADILDPTDPVDSLLEAVLRYETPSGSGGSGGAEVEAKGSAQGRALTPWRRVRYFFTEPSVRTAVLAALDRSAQRVAPLLTTEGGLSPQQARVAANAVAFGYFAALESWFSEGGTRPIADYVEEGLRPLRRIWSPVSQPEPRAAPSQGV